MSKTAVVLFNLGGPDSMKAVQPFLFNLFNDPAILNIPQPLRAIVAAAISMLRSGKAKAIYRHMGGRSPILAQTVAQAEALEEVFKNRAKDDEEFKVFVSMRYWNPTSDTVASKVKAYSPDRILLLPLYPQYSTTTTGSSFTDWDAACRRKGLNVPTTRVCCYPAELGFVAAHAGLIRDAYWKASENGKPRVLFSAHGLPEKIIEAGDPYQWQVEKTVASIVQVLTIDALDYAICYQSKVGKLPWIGPSTPEEIERAGKDKVPLVMVPVSFVSEHSETLVELDIDYRKLAEEKNVPGYWRVPALGTEPIFIEALADLCLRADSDEKVQSFTGKRYCSSGLTQCAKAA